MIPLLKLCYNRLHHICGSGFSTESALIRNDPVKEHGQPLDDAIALQLCLERDRLLSDPEFARSPSMCRLLRFLVDYKLSGNSVPLKSYTIATDALGRDASFDTQTDSYPRVQMGRLRRMLDNFYLRKGGEKRLVIAPNQYEIRLVSNLAEPDRRAGMIGRSADSKAPDQQSSPIPASDPLLRSEALSEGNLGGNRRGIVLVAIPILALLVAISAYFLWPAAEANDIAYPRVAVDLPNSGIDGDGNELSRSVGNRLIQGLQGFGALRIFDIRSGDGKGFRYIIRLRFLNPQLDEIELRLLDGTSGEILWSGDINAQDESVWKLELDRAIVAIAGHYGEIAQSEMSKVKDSYSAGYPCMLQFDVYVRYREQEKVKPLRECLQKSVERFPQDAYLLSVSALAQNMSENSQPESRGKGLGMLLARKAEALDHNSAAANFAVAQAAFFAGDCATGVAWGKKAAALNPLNSRILGYLGLYMIGCNMPEGESYASRALELDPNADLTVAAAVAFQMIKRGEAAAARQLSSQYMASSTRYEPALELTYIMSSAIMQDRKEARRVWKALAERYGFSETTPPREVLSRWISNPVLLDEIMKVMGRTGMFDRQDAL